MSDYPRLKRAGRIETSFGADLRLTKAGYCSVERAGNVCDYKRGLTVVEVVKVVLCHSSQRKAI